VIFRVYVNLPEGKSQKVQICIVQIIIDPDSFNAPGAKLRVVFDSVDRARAPGRDGFEA
jgi:hypothetical protein